jgi:5S rRNA maturation endonuclease (ribonuclease M5)
LLTKNGKKLELINKILERLEKKSKIGIPIVVEGKKDVISLNQLGIIGDLISAKTSGKSFLDTIREIEKRESREVILLFDFDRTGKEMTRRLAKHLERMRITPNLVFWKMFLGLVGRDVKDIESLATYISNLREKTSCRKV